LKLSKFKAGFNSLLQQYPNGFNNLDRRTTKPQIRVDLLGYCDISQTISLYGGVGLYFQGQSTIFQSVATTDLFKQSNLTDVNVAVSGGADFKLSDSWRLGGGYHSLRGITATVGYEF
jgi:opacity protein-like surface antigen